MLFATFTEAGAATVITALAGLTVAVTGLLACAIKGYLDFARMKAELRQRDEQATRRELENTYRDDRTDASVDLVVDSLLRRGRIEAKAVKDARGVPLLLESPDPKEVAMIQIRADVADAYKPVLPAFRQLRDENPTLSREQFGLLLEKTYGSWFARHICEIYKVSNFACLDIALLLVLDDANSAAC